MKIYLRFILKSQKGFIISQSIAGSILYRMLYTAKNLDRFLRHRSYPETSNLKELSFQERTHRPNQL